MARRRSVLQDWETTPDGRDGYQNIFLGRGWPVYLIDQPRRGRAGQSTESEPITPATTDASLWQIFRLGLYPEFYEGTQFPTTPEAIEQYWRQCTPSTGPEPDPVGTEPHPQIDAIVALLDRIGHAVLLTHSMSGRYGFLTGIRSSHLAAIVSYEPSQFPYRRDQVPAAIPGPVDPTVEHITAPILVDPSEPRSARRASDPDRVRRQHPTRARPAEPLPRHRPLAGRCDSRRTVRRTGEQPRGATSKSSTSPDAGQAGNTHFPFSDLNNLAVADLLSQFLARHHLDER